MTGSSAASTLRPTCPFCGSSEVARIQWGYPAWSDELAADFEAGRVVLGVIVVAAIGGLLLGAASSRRRRWQEGLVYVWRPDRPAYERLRPGAILLMP